MNHDPKRPTDHLDEFLEAGDPIKRSSLDTDEIESALDEIGTSITSRSRPAPKAAWRRAIRRPRAAILIGAAVIATGATVAGSSLLSARTGQIQPKKYVPAGGPGEILNPAAPDFRDVALQIASDIPWPDGYESWRDFEISQEIEGSDQGVRESSGALHGWFAMSAFCAWVLNWYQADISGDRETARQAAQVISAAPSWKAVRDEDPHPDPTVLGDMGTTKSTLFGWMLPYRDAVLAGHRARVKYLLVTGYYDGVFRTFDPGWDALEAAHMPEWRGLSENERNRNYAKYLASRTS
jgi:hypothetical protein